MEDKKQIEDQKEEKIRIKNPISIIRIVFLAAIAALILASYLGFNWQKNHVLEGEKRYSQNFPVFHDKEGRFRDESKTEFYTWIKENLGLRRQYMNLGATFKYFALERHSNDRVEEGRDGWYLYKDSKNIHIAYGDYPLTDEDLSTIQEKLTVLNNWCADHDIKFYFFDVPSKLSIYPEAVRSKDCQVRRDTPCDRIYNAISGQVAAVDIKTALLNQKENEYGTKLFLQKNTHWTPYGCNIAYKALIDRMAGDLADPTYADVTFEPGRLYGDLVQLTGMQNYISPSEDALVATVNDPQVTLTTETAPSTEPMDHYHNPASINGTAMVFGDSYTATQEYHFNDMMGATFTDYYYLQTNTAIELQDVLAVKPDYLILQWSERESSWMDKLKVVYPEE